MTDWQGWLDRWEAQQGGYMPDREERFGVMVDAVRALCGPTPHVVDLGCGPGSLARRLLEQIPGSTVTAIDMDPVLLAIGRNALGDMDGRLHWVDADLRGRWTVPSGLPPVDAALSTTALHWLVPDKLAGLYRHLGTVLHPGGVFLNGDRMDFPPNEPRLADAVRRLRGVREEHAGGAETWEAWWESAERDPAFAAEVEERARRHHDHPDHEHPLDVATHAALLRDAGFAEVDTIWQRLADRVLVAVR